MDELLQELNTKLDTLLLAQAKRPIEDGALYVVPESIKFAAHHI